MSDQPPPTPPEEPPGMVARRLWLFAIPALIAALTGTLLWLQADTSEPPPPTTTTTVEATTTTEPPSTGTSVETTTTTAPPGTLTRQQVIDQAGPTSPEDDLTRRGNLTISSPGQVVEGVYVTGVVTFEAGADNAVLRDCVVEGSRRGVVVSIANGATDVTVENCRLRATAPSEGVVGSLGGAPRQTIRRNVIEGQADGIKADSSSTYDANVIRVWKASGSTVHLDGLQASGRSDVTATRNVIASTIREGLNFGLFAESYAGGACRQMGTIDFSGNWVDGGNRGVVVYFMGHEGCATRAYAESVRVTGNTFPTIATGFRYSLWHTSSGAPSGVVSVGGNRLADGRVLTSATLPS